MNFNQFPLKPSLLKGLENLGFSQPTEIQEKTLPILLKNPQTDFHGQAQTGTGKTLAFGLPVLQTIATENNHVQALIVAPTRELVTQIHTSLTAVAGSTGIRICSIYGGVGIDRQIADLKKGVHLVIGTPGRLIDHISRKTLSLQKVSIIVLDEADTMLDMGFRDEVEELLKACSGPKNIWLFSATVKPGLHDLLKAHVKNPVSVRINSGEVATHNTEQYLCAVSSKYRFDALCRFIDMADSFYGFIFCSTKVLTQEIAQQLAQRGYKAQALNGDMPQARRNHVIKAFRNKEFTILVATDVAARGIDIPNITHVINYGLPEDQENYVHRIGRTGRAGKQGVAITLLDAKHAYRLKYLERKFKLNIKPLAVPSVEVIIQKRMSNLTTVPASLEQAPQNVVKKLQEWIIEQPQETLQHVLTNLLYTTYFSNLTTQEVSISAARPENSDRYESSRSRPRRHFGRRPSRFKEHSN